MNSRVKVNRRAVLAILCCAVLACGLGTASLPEFARAQSEEGVVILLNARNPTQSLSNGEIAKIFLGQTAFWHGVVPVKVFVRPDGSGAAKAFYAAALSMTPQAYRKHWDTLQLSGRAVAGKQLGTVEEVAQAVAQAPGAIGFALASEAWKINAKGVKIIQVH